MKQMDDFPLVLGTAQLGMHYGAVNQFGKPDPSEAAAIVQGAWDGGVRFFDTSQQYGDAEAVLGNGLKGLDSDEALVISKLNPQIDGSKRSEVFEAVECSLKRLGVSKLWGLMLHHQMDKSLDEDNWDVLYPILMDVKSQNLVDHLGISLSYPDFGIRALDREGLDFIQAPFNLLDQRIIRNGLVDAAARHGVVLFIRSIYLQGVLLNAPDSLPEKMRFAIPVFEKVQRMANEIKLNRMELFMGYVLGKLPHAKVLFGAETANQVAENLDLLGNLPLSNSIISRLDGLAEQVNDPRVYDPIEWYKMGIQQVW